MILTENTEGRNLVFDFIKAQSIAVADAADLKAKLHECYNRVTAAMPELVTMGHVCCVYAYDQQDQPSDAPTRGCDGICNYATANGVIHTAIGLSRAALYRSCDYADFVLLHEFAHAINPEETRKTEFHQYLDYLILEYNQKTGKNIKNDHIGL